MRIALVLGLVLVTLLGAEPQDTLASFREARSLALPVYNQTLADLCTARAQALAASGRLQHEDASGRSPALQSLAAGFPPGVYGEVLGAGPWPAVWSAWLASPSHRAVLEDSGWTQWGWGRAEVGGTTVWVLRFWSP